MRRRAILSSWPRWRTLCATIGVATDEQGIVPDALEEELARREKAGELARVKAIYVVSYYDNPMGVTTLCARRQRLLEIARRWSREGTIYVIEDAAYRELRYYGDDVPEPPGTRRRRAGHLRRHVFETVFTGHSRRLGRTAAEVSGTGPGEKGNVDFGSPHFSQVLIATAMELVFSTAMLPASARATASSLMLRWKQPMLNSSAGREMDSARRRAFLWLKLPATFDTGIDRPLFQRAVAEGMLYVPGECCYPLEGCPRRRDTLRLASASLPSKKSAAA